MQEEKDLFELEVEGDESTPEMEMELEIDADELEETVAKNVEKQEQKKREAEKSKRGPKGPRKNKEEGEAEKKSAKKDIDLSNVRILEREIKKGTVAAPQGRIEKIVEGENAGKYRMLLAEGGVMIKKDVKEYEEVGIIDKLQEGKWVLTNIAAERYGKKFNHQTDEGQTITHHYVRVELHKPGREKDVTEIYPVPWAFGEAEKATNKAKQREEAEEKKKAKEEEKETSEE